jgi:hypothetical protein
MKDITTHAGLRSNRAAASISAAVLLCALAWLGHRLVFAQFQDYDDEGYLLLTVQQFLRGLPLYDEVYTQYGPAYYLWQQILHTLFAIPVTHDATRVVTVAAWLTSATLVGGIVWLLTKRPLLTAIGTAVAFLHLTQLTFEPGHPQELCLLAVLGALALMCWRLVVNKHMGVAASMTVGVVVAVTALTKSNIGVFLVGALTLGLVTSVSRSRSRTWLEPVALAAAMAAVPALMRGDLLRLDIAACIVVVWTGLLAVFISRSGDADEDGVVTARDIVAGVSGFAIGCAVIVATIIYEGTSPGALFEGLFVAPLMLPKVFWRPLPVPLLFAAVASASLFAAWYWQRGVIAHRRWLPFAALAGGLIMFLLSIAKAYGPLFAVGPLLVWLVLADPSVSAEQRAARRIVAFAAILMALQAYPMPAGTQIAIGTVLFVPLALITIAGAERTLSGSERAPAAQRSLRRRAILATLAVAVAANIGIKAQRLYARGIPLEMPGARAVRTTERDAATYWWLRANLRENCDGFITAPGLNSLHFWTQIAPISALNTTLWPLLFDTDQQRRVVEAAAPVERFCVAWSPTRMRALASAPDAASRPLVIWLQREFEPRGRFGDWEFRIRRGRSSTHVYEASWVDGGAIAIVLPPVGRDAVTRVAVLDLDAERSLGDSARGEEIVVLDEEGVRLRVDDGIDVSRHRRLTVRPGVTAPSASNRYSVVVRLWASDGRTLAIVPVVCAADSRVIHTSSPIMSGTDACTPMTAAVGTNSAANSQ